jgi:hypothetical protein
MKFRNLNINGDWTFGNGLQNYVIDNTAILLNLKTRLYSFLGDCFFDRTSGIDWFNLLSLKSNDNPLGLEIKRIINSTEGVTAVNYFEITFNSDIRQYSIYYNINTIFTSNQNQTLNNIYTLTK